MAEPEWVLLSEDQIYVKEVEHLYCLTPRVHKEATLYKLIEYENPASSMIFCNTREETRVVATFLAQQGAGGGDAVLRPAAEEARAGDGALPQRRDPPPGDDRRRLARASTSRTSRTSSSSRRPTRPSSTSTAPAAPGRVGKTGRAISLVGALDLMNFNRLVKRYHVEVQELPVPTDEEVAASARSSGSSTTLAEAGRALSLDDFVDLGPVARRIADHELRDRIVAACCSKRHLAAPPCARSRSRRRAPRRDRPRGDGGGRVRRQVRRAGDAGAAG